MFLSIAQREEVLEKIGAEREFLFGKLKYGVTKQRRDECRESFFKWCDLRGIPYKTWEKVETHYHQWKSTFKKNQEERERSGSKVELDSKELNHFGVIAGLFRQIGCHSSRFVLFCSF